LVHLAQCFDRHSDSSVNLHSSAWYVVKLVFDPVQAVRESSMHQLAASHSQNVVKCLDTVMDRPASMGGTGGAFLILEYANYGDLFGWTLRNHHAQSYADTLAALTLRYDWIEVSQSPRDRDDVQREAVELFLDLLRAVRASHEKGVFHRDIKLENTLVCRDWKTGKLSAKLSDFGLATTETKVKSIRFGTESTMAPELICGHGKNIACYPELADRWSLGIVLHSLLTGLSLWPIATTDHSEAYVYYLAHGQKNLEAGAQAIIDLSSGSKESSAPNRRNSKISRRLALVISGLLRVVPEKRTSLESAETQLLDVLKRWSNE